MSRLQALFVAFLFIASTGLANSELVKQIRSSSPTGSSGAWGLQPFGSDAIFRAWDVDAGTRLWKTDGTTAGTVPLLDLSPGTDDSSLAFTTIGNTIWIGGNDGRHGLELWTSDGTQAGTTMILDIVPGARGSSPSSFTTAGAYVYFLADDGVHGRELWRSDGTAAGTRMVREIVPGAAATLATAPKIIGPVAAGLLFMANDGTRGWELWVTDGTEEGTRIVKEIVPGSGSIDLDPATVVKVGTDVYLPLK